MKYEVDKAPQWRSTYGLGAFEVLEKTTKMKLDIHNCEQVLHYQFESFAIKDALCGASTLSVPQRREADCISGNPNCNENPYYYTPPSVLF